MNHCAEPRWPIELTRAADPRRARLARLLQVATFVALAAWPAVTVIQFQASLARKMRKAAEFDRAAAAGKVDPGRKRPEGTKGAMLRWRPAINEFWAGVNIYSRPTQEQELAKLADDDEEGTGTLHPNLPVVVILMTPLTWLPPWWSSLAFQLLKVAVLAVTAVASVRLVCHGRGQVRDWVAALALALGLRLAVGDIQHANNNMFALGAIVAHLWLYRRGRDMWAGGALALAVTIKLTPALFLVYWLWQRNVRLLAGAAIGLAVLLAVIPAAALGPQQAWDYAATWDENLLVPNAAQSIWYPTLVNQSLAGVTARYFLDGPEGNIYWDPEHDPYHLRTRQGWITVAALPDWAARAVLRVGQGAILLATGWAVGLRRLGRDDARRSLHYAIVLTAMMLLNQRTWDHHAAVLLPAYVAVLTALAYGRMSRRVRLTGVAMMSVAAAIVMLKGTSLFEAAAGLLGRGKEIGEHWADVFTAYGPTFYHFALLLAVAVLLARALRNADPPYADCPQSLRAEDPTTDATPKRRVLGDDRTSK